MAEGGLERERERDLIEAGLNEAAATAKVFDDGQARTRAQLGRYGTDIAIWGK